METSVDRRLFAVSATALVTALALTAPVPASSAPREGAPSVPLSSCHHPDATMPTWGTPVFTPPSVDVTEQPASVTVTLPVTDHGGPGASSGMSSVQTEILGQNLTLKRTSADLWSATFTVARNTASGMHTLRGVSARDKAGNVRDSFDDGVAYPELATTLELIATPPPADAEPTPTALTLSKEKVNVKQKARKVKIRLSVDESTAEVAKAVVTFSLNLAANSLELQRTADGFAGKVKIPRGWAGNHKVRVTGIRLTDEYGTTHITRRGAVKNRLGVPPVKVRSRKDKAAPEILASRISPQKIDARNKSKKVTVTVRARDNKSGVKQVRAHVGPDTEIVLKKVKGTRKLGTWRGSTRVGPCDQPYKPARLYLSMIDRAGNHTDGFGARFSMKSNDLKRPRAHLLHPDNRTTHWPADGPVRLRFNEPATGVNQQSFVVLPLEGLYWGAPLTGTLSCEKASGAAVACGSRHVREVVWTPEPGTLPAGGSYAVMLNPDGNNDIRDRAGNPHKREELGFGTLPPTP